MRQPIVYTGTRFGSPSLATSAELCKTVWRYTHACLSCLTLEQICPGTSVPLEEATWTMVTGPPLRKPAAEKQEDSRMPMQLYESIDGVGEDANVLCQWQ